MNKSILNSLFITSVITVPAAHAEGAFDADNFSANIAVTSNYVFRGVSLSDDGPAISGGLDWEYNGFYLGTWASSIDQVEEESFEIDYYGGYTGEVGAITYSLDYIYYDYPGADDHLAYYEYGGSLSYAFAGDMSPVLGALILHSPDFYYETGDATAYEAFLDLSLPNEFGLGFYYGKQKLDEDYNGGIDAYDYYGVNLSKTLGAFDLTFGYSDTDDEGEDWAGDNNSEWVFTIGTSL